jgi:hypothetical protein
VAVLSPAPATLLLRPGAGHPHIMLFVVMYLWAHIQCHTRGVLRKSSFWSHSHCARRRFPPVSSSSSTTSLLADHSAEPRSGGDDIVIGGCFHTSAISSMLSIQSIIYDAYLLTYLPAFDSIRQGGADRQEPLPMFRCPGSPGVSPDHLITYCDAKKRRRREDLLLTVTLTYLLT